MAQDVTFTMDGMLLNWLKEVGEEVKSGEIIAEFEADKATVELEAPGDGVLVETLIDIGDEVAEGAVVARIAAAGEASGGKAAAPSSAPAPTPQKPAAAPPPTPSSSNGNGSAAATLPDGRIKASPVAKRIAADKGIDLSRVAGTGPGGRITKSDIETFDPATAPPAAKPAAAPAKPAAKAPAAAAMGYQSYGALPEGDDVTIEDVSRMRKLIAEGTVTSWNTTPHFFVTVEVDVEPLLNLRQQLNAPLADDGVKISVNDMLVKATALALKKYPNLNSHFYGDKIVRNKHFNVAIAVALPNNGLVNVVSPDADKTSLSAMAQYHKQMFDAARQGNIKREYITGGTFLVSNLGAYGVESFSSIIDPPQAGAIAVGASRKVPVVLPDNTLGIGTRMKMTLSIDHRVSDGAEGAQFMNYLKDLLENPMRLLV